MSEENKTVDSTTVSEQPTQESPASSPDDGGLIAESKKYRKRAQDAEARIAELELSASKKEEAKLKEIEDYKTLYEKASSENESLSSVAEKWTKYEETKRASLLESHPEEDRESLANLPLDTLEFVTNKINSNKANVPEVAGKARGAAPKKDIDWADKDYLKENWAEISKSYKQTRK